MTKAVYDPQNSGKISGGTTGAGTGGQLTMTADVANGGSISTAGFSTSGGNITTYGGSAAGGDIATHDGGGSINTRGTGSIQLGLVGSRTTISGNASVDRSVALPDASGTVYVTANPVTPAPDGTYPIPTSITIVSGIITAIS